MAFRCALTTVSGGVSAMLLKVVTKPGRTHIIRHLADNNHHLHGHSLSAHSCSRDSP